MAKETYFYTGKGVLHHNGKDYGYGKALPADLPEETLKSMVAKKKASTTKPAGPQAAAADSGAEVQALKERIAGMEQAAAEGTAYIEELRAERDDLAAKLEQAQATITELSNAQLAAAPPAGAGPKK